MNRILACLGLTMAVAGPAHAAAETVALDAAGHTIAMLPFGDASWLIAVAAALVIALRRNHS